MRAYGYVRVSRDEDGKKESIDTQRRVLHTFAKEKGIVLVDVLEDNNVSGYTMERPGFNKLKELILAGGVDLLLVKDLSRVGRHNAKVLLFLDELTDAGIRLLLMNDNYDSSSDDDTILGIKTWYNELYLKDLSKKITTNIRQRQREGLVIVESYGYLKAPNDKNKLLIDESTAHIVRLIFSMYLEGMGCTTIARQLTLMGITTPSMQKFHRDGFSWKPDWVHKDKWSPTGVRRIVTNDAYIGTLRCGVSKIPRMKGKRTLAPKDQHIVHENFMEAIISREDFEAAQIILAQRTKNKQRAGQNQRAHRYSGILKCAECGNGFTSRSRRDKDGNLIRIAYNCTTNFRFGKDHCTSHTIHESTVDDLVFGQLETILRSGSLQISEIERRIDEDAKKPDYMAKHRENLIKRIADKKEEVKDYARQYARRLIDEEIFEELSMEARTLVAQMELQLSLCATEEKHPEKDKKKFRNSLKQLEVIIENRDLTPLDIATLIDHIDVHETDVIGAYKLPEMKLTIYWNIPQFESLIDGIAEVG